MEKDRTPQFLAEPGWGGLYRLAGAGALLAVAFIVLDIALSFAGGDAAVGRLSAAEWFAHLQENPLMGLRNLGLINVINTALTIPFYLAIYRMHRERIPAGAALALVVFVLGAAVYIANNQALSLLSLSGQHAAAGSEAQQALLEAAGTAVLAQAEDFTPGTLPGFLLCTTASLLSAVVMLRGGLLRRWVAITGLAGWGILLVFTIMTTFVPETFEVTMPLAALGGLLTLTWQLATALELLRRAAPAARATDQTELSAANQAA